MRRVAAAAMVLLTSLPAWSLEAIPGEGRFQQLLEPGKDQNSATASAGIGKIGDDWFLLFEPRFDLNLGAFGLGLQVPLNIRIVDEVPKAEGDIEPLRSEDWDEPTEFLRVIRYVRWGNKRDFIYARLGELAADIGHGTIMNRYLNNTDVDTFHLGLQADVNTRYGGVETIFSDLGMFAGGYDDARVAGGRAYIKPVALWDASSIFNIFQVGFTLLMDQNAPLTLRRGEVATRDQAIIWGVDAEAEVLNNWLLELIPYVDLNFFESDAGFHMGANFKLKIPFLIELSIPVKVEYRVFGSRYIPTYFNEFYEVERVASPTVNPNLSFPKLALARCTNVPATLCQDGTLLGWHGDMAFDIAGYVQVGALYEDYDGSPGGNLALFVSVPALEWLQAKAYYARTGITGADDIFAFDDRSIAVAEAKYEIITYLWAVARFTRKWRIEGDTVESVDDWKFGVEFTYTF